VADICRILRWAVSENWCKLRDLFRDDRVTVSRPGRGQLAQQSTRPGSNSQKRSGGKERESTCWKGAIIPSSGIIKSGTPGFQEKSSTKDGRKNRKKKSREGGDRRGEGKRRERSSSIVVRDNKPQDCHSSTGCGTFRLQIPSGDRSTTRTKKPAAQNRAVKGWEHLSSGKPVNGVEETNQHKQHDRVLQQKKKEVEGDRSESG